MGKIVQLDKNTINKIAAGEVIERPSAVVKELVENALDASAGAITIEIKDGGISMIRITDNGSGISQDDIHKAFLRHATSKITTIEDLFTVKSLGFRGEALASIASVAQVELITKVSNDLLGTRYVIEGGEEKSTESIGCPSGTTFIVRNLFYNTPVRRKFLKTASTEAGYVSELVERLAISHPNVAFKFIANGQTKMHTSGNGNMKDIIYCIYGRDITANVKEVDFMQDDFTITGYIGKPIISRGNRNYENYFINKRFIKSSIISKAIEEAYKPYSMQHKYPFVTLLIDINTQTIDVNVHPTKMEIRFSNPEEIYSNVYHAVSDTLIKTTLITQVSLENEKKESSLSSKPPKKVSVPEPFEKNRLARQNSKVAENVSNYSLVSRVPGSISDNPINNSNTTESILTKDEEENKKKNHKKNEDININKEQQSGVLIDPHQKHMIDDSNSKHLICKENKVQENKVNLQKNEVVLQKNEKLRTEENEVVIQKNDEKKLELQQEQLKYQESQDADNKNTSEVSKNKDESHKLKANEQLTLFDSSSQDNQLMNLKIVGQVFLTYWIIELDSKMYIIDQHAAHEKVMYEKIMKRLSCNEYSSQIISPSIIVCLSMKEEEKLKSYKDIFKKIGFEIEHFGGRDYCISAVPNDMLGIASKDLFLELLDSLDETDRYTPDIILEKTATMACKAAVKGNNKMSVLEAEHLIREMFLLDNPFNCPHGRPTTVCLTKNELEKKFKRVL